MRPHIVVTLVNGTFAKDAEWVRPGSPLARYLREHLGDGAVVEPCPWDGGNSTAARHEGAKKVAERIARVARDSGGSAHFVVAHSHGGNVVIQALRRSPGTVRGVVCLNTPFLHSRPRSFFLLGLLAEYPFTPVMLPAFVLLLYMYFTRYHPMYPDRYLWPLLRSVVWAWLWMPIGALFVKPYARLVERLGGYIATARARAEALLVPDTTVPDVSVLAVTVPGDEAYWWLRLIDALSLVVRVPLYVALASLVVAIVFNNFARVLAIFGLSMSWQVSTFTVGLVAIGGYVLAQAFVLVVIPAVRGHLLSYGEGRWESVLFDTAVKPNPVGMSPSQVVRVPARVLLMRHSALYSQRQVAELIVEWMRALTASVAQN